MKNVETLRENSLSQQGGMSSDINNLSLAKDHYIRLCDQFKNEPAYSFVGMELSKLSVGYCETTTIVRPELLHHRGAVQGGVVAMIADATAGYTALSVIPEDAKSDDMATIEFKTSYYRPAFAEKLICLCNASFVGGRIVFCRAQVFLNTPDPENLCAEATLTFARLRAKV